MTAAPTAFTELPLTQNTDLELHSDSNRKQMAEQPPRAVPVAHHLADERVPVSAGHVELRTVMDVTRLTLAERVARAEQIFIVTRARQKVLDEIARCHVSFGCATPLCGLIYGVTGEGKSALHEHYSQDFTPFELTEGTNVPVLSVTIEAGATPKSVACALLRQLGDPQWDKGSRGILLRKVAGLIRDCKVSLIIFDEFQHLISRETKRVMIEVADWLKTLIIETKVPVIAFGQPEALKVLANHWCCPVLTDGLVRNDQAAVLRR